MPSTKAIFALGKLVGYLIKFKKIFPAGVIKRRGRPKDKLPFLLGHGLFFEVFGRRNKLATNKFSSPDVIRQVELNSIYDKFLNQLRKLPLYGLKKISLKLAAFLKN